MGKTVGNLDKHIQIDLSNFSVNGHTHSYVPLSGGTMTGNLKFSDVTSTTYPAVSSKITWNGSTDGADIYYQVDAADKGRLVLNTRDDADCLVAFANKGTIKTTIDNSGNFSGNAATATKLATARSITLSGAVSGTVSFDGTANAAISTSIAKPPKSGDWWSGGIPIINADGVMEVGKYIDFHNTDTSTNDYDTRLVCNSSGAIILTLPSAAGTLARVEDNVASATKLQTARTLTIGSTGKTFNGTANVSWSLSEIGAAASDHGHTILGSIDSRNVNSAPNTYTARGITPEFKASATIGLPNTGKNFAGVITYQQWSDTTNWSGGKTTQFATLDDGRMYYRKGEGTTWGDWGQFYTTTHKPTYSDVGAAASSHGTHVTYATATPKANGTAAIGTVNRVAREDHVHPLQTSVAQLTTARTLTIGNTGKSFNGTANVSWSLSEIGAVGRIRIPTAGEQNTYVKIMEIGDAGSGNMHAEALVVGEGNYGTTQHTFGILRISSRGNRLVEYTTLLAHDSGTFEVGYVRDDTNKKTIVYLKRGTYPGGGAIIPLSEVGCSFITSLTNLTTAPTGYTKGATRTMALTTSNVASASKLATARTLTIGNTGKSFDGSANVSWTLAEIGALPTAGGTMTGMLTMSPIAYDSAYTKAGVFTDTNVKRSMIRFLATSGSNDGGAFYHETSATTADTNKGVLHLCPSDDNTNDGTDYVSIHGTNDAESIKLHTGGNASFAGTVTAPTFSGALSGNAATATKATQLTNARTINGTSFDGSANITTANWGTSRKINQISVNGSADVKLPLDYYTCYIGSTNTKPYHHILTTGQCTGDYTDKSITIVLVNHYNGAGLGIAKATLRTNKASAGDTATAELRWLVRSGFAENQLCFNLKNTAKDTYMDVFYKASGTYNSLTWYVLTEGARGSHGSQWTKYNTHHDNGTAVYDEAGMKALRSYTSTLQSATDHGNVNYAKSANTATSATTASAANVLNKNTRMDYGWDGLNYFSISGTAGNAAKANDTPTTAWWHIIRCNHANSSGYYTDIAVPFNAASMYYKRITNGAVQNSGWVQILDKLNYKSTVTPANIGAEVATATHSTVDITSSGFTSKGTKTADTMASTGNCYSLTSATSSMVLASGNFNAVKFGKYALCLRIMSSNITSTANILTVTVKHGSTTLLTKNIKGTDFTSTSQYSNIYTSFDFNGTSSARGTLSVQISTGTTSGITFKFDYAYITLMTPSVFI